MGGGGWGGVSFKLKKDGLKDSPEREHFEKGASRGLGKERLTLKKGGLLIRIVLEERKSGERRSSEVSFWGRQYVMKGVHER